MLKFNDVSQSKPCLQYFSLMLQSLFYCKPVAKTMVQMKESFVSTNPHSYTDTCVGPTCKIVLDISNWSSAFKKTKYLFFVFFFKHLHLLASNCK